MNRRLLFFIFVGVLAGIHVGTVRRTDDPIRNTQTDGIAYQQKLEEEKDGKKGPLAYSVKYNPSDTFFVDPPFNEKEKSAAKEKAVPEKPAALSDWWEEKPVQENVTSPGEEAPERAGALEEKGPVPEGTTGEEAGQTAAPGKEAKSGDYWW